MSMSDTLSESQISLGMKCAIEMARKSLLEEGVPVGSCILNIQTNEIIAQGHNKRVQEKSWIKHGETDCIESLPQSSFSQLNQSALFTTLSPCSMCTGAILLYRIPIVVIGESQTFLGEEELLASRGVKLIHVDSDECKELMRKFIEKYPNIWNADIGLDSTV
jgi:creatinine deaminase